MSQLDVNFENKLKKTPRATSRQSSEQLASRQLDVEHSLKSCLDEIFKGFVSQFSLYRFCSKVSPAQGCTCRSYLVHCDN